ncbi:metallophosphoesterase [Streptomyces sp. EAS-AB2608]|uniref:metallophosphoesterase family protein n=1 Tax=Streptomyces sp. EAS-AB2608 TaxID=2779671 RepID=UPI0021A57E5C|nr:metallophosphoesterase [Streptomyces sp. EAS-AB2608]
MLALVGVLSTAASATAVSASPTFQRPALQSAGPRPPDPTRPPEPVHPPRPTPPPGAADGEAWAWTQLTGRGTQIRYVSTDTSRTCPAVRYTLGTATDTVRMHVVSTPSTPQFPTTVCELGVPLTASDARLEGVSAATLHPANGRLPLPTWTSMSRPERIAVIGDTGCEVPTAGPVQSCRTGWPFPVLANSIATVTQPDLVIHVGDYFYREDPAKEDDPRRNPGCTTTAEAASWACVVADFFRPAETLLARAPIALTRGNHEDCNSRFRGGAGAAWFHYLADELRADDSCDRHSAPVAIRAGTLNLVSLDSSYADPDDTGSTAGEGIFTAQFDQVNQDAQQHPHDDYFLFTHKPLWMVKSAGQQPGEVTWLTRVLSNAVADTPAHSLAPNVRLVLSGHVHLYQMIDFNTARPPQVTVGSSGGPLDDGPDDRLVHNQPVGTPPQPVNQSITQTVSPAGGPGIFGYADLRSTGGTWDLAFRRANGAALGPICTLSTRLDTKSFQCAPGAATDGVTDRPGKPVGGR